MNAAANTPTACSFCATKFSPNRRQARVRQYGGQWHAFCRPCLADTHNGVFLVRLALREMDRRRQLRLVQGGMS